MLLPVVNLSVAPQAAWIKYTLSVAQKGLHAGSCLLLLILSLFALALCCSHTINLLSTNHRALTSPHLPDFWVARCFLVCNHQLFLQSPSSLQSPGAEAVDVSAVGSALHWPRRKGMTLPRLLGSSVVGPSEVLIGEGNWPYEWINVIFVKAMAILGVLSLFLFLPTTWPLIWHMKPFTIFLV